MLGNANAVVTIGVKDLGRAREFYEATLGLTVDSEMPEAQLVVYRSGDSLVQIYETDKAGTNQATYVTWEVDDVDGVVSALKDKGVGFEHYPEMPEVTVEGDLHVWGDDRVAWFRDPDGNTLCLHNKQ